MKLCEWCTTEFRPASKRQKFCNPRCLKARDDARYYAKNRERIIKQTGDYAKARRSQARDYFAQYRAENRTRVREYSKEWNRRNRAACVANTAKYRARKDCRTPAWLTPLQLQHIKMFYEAAADLTKEFGILMSVDHIMPLRGELSSGLHVPWNLQVISLSENSKKGNR